MRFGIQFLWQRCWNTLQQTRSNIVKSKQGVRKWIILLVMFVALIFVLRSLGRRNTVEETLRKAQEENAADFERLLYYIQHPQTLCNTALSLGGSKDAKNRMDGDKVVCQDTLLLKKPCLVYSFGGNDEWSFEEDVERFGCKVYTFDPSLAMKHHEHKPNIWFYQVGISHYSMDRFLTNEMTMWRMRPLDEIMEALGHRDKQIDVLKLDIEGDEWDVLEDISNKGLLKKINHLCVEVHLHSMDWSRKMKILQSLEEANMRFFSSRKNLVTKPKLVPGGNRTEQLFYELAWFRDENKT